MMTQIDKTILTNLLKEIKDKSLENTLRQVIFSDISLLNTITFERPETEY